MPKRPGGADLPALKAIKDGLKLESEQRVRNSAAARLAHGASHNPACPLCVHPHRDTIEEHYIGWWKTNELAALSGLSEDEVCIHMEAMQLHTKRVRNRRALFSQMLERGYSNLDGMEISPELMLALAAELNRMDGDIIHRVESKETRHVTFAPFPGATGATDDPAEKEARRLGGPDPVPGVLPPVSVVDVTPSEAEEPHD